MFVGTHRYIENLSQTRIYLGVVTITYGKYDYLAAGTETQHACFSKKKKSFGVCSDDKQDGYFHQNCGSRLDEKRCVKILDL